ncbi:MAG: NERD domain-containing protein [Clostridia bacterium]|nr:NERD domain-containing protein [Clostridia bacterium]
MAKMFPDVPKEIQVGSQEDIMFESLKRLPDDYYVFHSFKIVKTVTNTLYESETDFVIFNATKGLLCIEAKSGSGIAYRNGTWYYGSGRKMHGDGPYAQADHNKWKLFSYIQEMNSDIATSILAHCKFLHAVWFPSISKAQFNSVSIPAEGDKRITLLRETLDSPQKDINAIFDIDLPNGVQTNLSKREVQYILDNALCPSFNLIPSMSIDIDNRRKAFNRLLEEQSNILNYLEDQNSAVINGVAGTGKTMIALEKARRHSENGEKVLFLCFNNKLKDFLSENYHYENVAFYTIDGFACKMCGTRSTDFSLLKEKLIEIYCNKCFEYKHIIIDEGQDFGQDRIEEESIIELLEQIILDNDNPGSFYLFYDKLQLIQGRIIPKYISDADCRLTLYKNCRNTESIATTSMKPLNCKPKIFTGVIEGDTPKLYFADGQDTINYLNYILSTYIEANVKNIVILSCKTNSESIICSYLDDDSLYPFRNKRFIFSTCRKFKGLEADAIIMIDVDKMTFLQNEKLFYVGASRARLFLNIIAQMTDEDCTEVLTKYNDTRRSKNIKKTFAAAINTIECKL